MKNLIPISAIPVSLSIKNRLNYPEERYDDYGFLKIRSPKESRELAKAYATTFGTAEPPAGDIYGAGLIVTAWRILFKNFAAGDQPFESTAILMMTDPVARRRFYGILDDFKREYPASNKDTVFIGWMLTRLVQENPAFAHFSKLYQDNQEKGEASLCWSTLESIDKALNRRPPEDETPLATQKRPIIAAPSSIKDQLLYILTHWIDILGDWIRHILGALDMIEEETRSRMPGPGVAQGPGIELLDGIARFSSDDDWMPKVVLLAKNVLVWLNQLSKAYNRNIRRLDEIPDEELDIMVSRGFNALWLIGLWERSPASREMKRRMGNPEAAASAYSIYRYDIAEELGSWPALENLRTRAAQRGIRLSSDMVPNHVGIDSDWTRHHPERLLGVSECPYPGYSFFSDDLSGDESVDIRLEDHYWNKSDAAVVFQRRDPKTGECRFIYHGNDGTSMPWNDTAQINFLKPEAREAVIQEILHVARHFPIIRFDAAMVLARKHIRRLWFPAAGSGGDIPSRSEHALSDEEFNSALPGEFWREVVDRVAVEVPGTILLAEAFWMMEGYFVRSLGMHRVYNSAFMNMLRDQKNSEYRRIIKDTLAFDSGILQRFVNFMNNPDEETAVNQYGKDDRYFSVCTLLATLPGLPMIGHGQIEGFTEKYGMEYTRAYSDETPDEELIARHEREIFPLLTRRHLFAGASSFRLYDLHGEHGIIESVFAYSNAFKDERALIVVNNSYDRAVGSINLAFSSSKSQEKLASALIPEDVDDSSWLLLKDHVAGLWYIRAVGDLRDTGLRLSIDGFGRQTFLDIHSVPETEDGMWRALAEDLDGAGVPDPYATMTQIRLRPIKEALTAFLPYEIAYRIAESIGKGISPTALVNKDAMIAALSRLESLGASSTQSPAKKLDMILRRLESAAKLWRFPRRYLRRYLYHQFGDTETDDALFMAIWSITSVLGAEKWNDWDMENWIQTHLKPSTPIRLCQNLDLALHLPSWQEMAKNPNLALGILMVDETVRQACGVNQWNGETWYNREGWNAFVRTTILLAGGNSLSWWSIFRLIRHWAKAAKASKYRLDLLLKPLC